MDPNQQPDRIVPTADPESNIIQFRPPTRAQARAKREQEKQGFLLPLPFTDGNIHMAHLSLADQTTLMGLPGALQAQVTRIFDEERKAKKKNAALTFDRLVGDQKRSEELANAIFCRGAINPRVYPTEADIPPEDTTALVVKDFHIRERTKYLAIVLGSDEEEIAALVPFRPGTTGGPVPVAPAFHDPEPAVGPAGDAGGGV